MTDPLLPPQGPREGDGSPPDEGGVGFAAIGGPTPAGPTPAGASPAGPTPAAATPAERSPASQPPAIPPPEHPTPAVSVGGPGYAPPQPPPVEPPPPAKKSSIGLLVTFVAVATAAIGAILVKFVLPLAIAGVAGQVIDSAFGGPYARLPGDVRSGFEDRLKTAIGERIKDQSDAEQSATILVLVKSGLPRLGDALVDSNFRLTSKALAATDVASCAAVSRAIVSGGDPPENASTAMINALSDADLRQWFEIRISAIEAEVRGSPDQVVVTDEAVNPLYDKLFAVMSSDDIDTLGSLASGEAIDDAPLCAAVRSLYAAVLTLSAQETTLFARYDVSP